jgi:hypothetical protein
MTNIYVGSAKYAAVSAWAASSTRTVGDLRRQLATPTVGNERVFRASAITTGVTGSTEPSWTLTASGTTVDSGVTWTEVTGQATYNESSNNWAAPHARLENAYAWSTAGDTIVVGTSHAQTSSAATNLSCPGTAAAPCSVICVDDTATMPPVAANLTTGGSITTTGFSGINTGGFAYLYGLSYSVGTSNSSFSVVSNADNVHFFSNCTINIANGSTGAGLKYPGYNAVHNSCARFTDSTFLFSHAGQSIQPQYGAMDFINCQFATTGTVPTSLFGVAGNSSGACTVRDCDLSKITGSLVNVGYAANVDLLFQNCKLNASVSMITGSFTSLGGVRVRVHNCDSGGTNYHLYEADYAGTLTHETTIVRSGGASNGATSESHKIVTTSNAKFTAPFRSIELVQWNALIGSPLTATVEIVSNTTLTDGDIWIDVEYPSDASSAKGSNATSRKANLLSSNTNLPSSTATWAGGLTTPQYLSVTFTPQQAGPVKVRLQVGKASQTVYYDPLFAMA